MIECAARAEWRDPALGLQFSNFLVDAYLIQRADWQTRREQETARKHLTEGGYLA